MPVRIDYFKKLCELCQAFGTARNRRELLEMIFASAMETLEGKAACLYLTEPGKPELLPVAQKGLSEMLFPVPEIHAGPEDRAPGSEDKAFSIAGTRRRTPNWSIPTPRRPKASPRSWRCR